MKKTPSGLKILAAGLIVSLLWSATWLYTGHAGFKASPPESPKVGSTRSSPGTNRWNRGRQPADLLAEMERYHGHVGPWNVLGWRIGQAAMRELGTTWGDHRLQIVCHIPTSTPFSCLIEGLMVGTGNSQGRLDLRIAEELTPATVHVSILKAGTSEVVEFWPSNVYLKKIANRPADELDALVKECAAMTESDLFVIRRP